ncbi:MAG: hypothetical protein ACHQQS_00520 [Thermoanaerobaculales bacterium]
MKRVIIFGVFVALLASQAFAVYVIVLRNGSRVVARDKYQVKGANAVFTTKVGTVTSLPLSQVDVAATDKVNAAHLGDAQTLDWVDAEQHAAPTPTPTPPVAGIGKIKPGVAKSEGFAARPTPTPGIMFHENHYRDAHVEEAFEQGLESYHLYLNRTSMGTQPTYVFIEVQVNGQRETLKALEAVCITYKLLAEKAPERVPERVEVQMLNESGREAGVFRLSVADATELVAGKTTPENFFVRHVIF